MEPAVEHRRVEEGLRPREPRGVRIGRVLLREELGTAVVRFHIMLFVNV